ncbi:VWA domain-containing protein, partial [Candidatus Woesearchaeota archaeon]|nr:VWA domain-containing protein [Candidatus Woesearchaeota archaeon]
MSPTDEENKLMNSVIQGDKDEVDNARMMEESINNNLGSFVPDVLMQQMVKNYKQVRQLYGDTIMRLLSSYNPDYIEKNIKIPEFQRELQKSIKNKIQELKQKNILNEDGSMSKLGEKLSSLIMCIDELDDLKSKGYFGERVNKKKNPYGMKDDVRNYKKGDKYSDIALKKSITLAIKRGHKTLHKSDLKTFERLSKGSINIIYGLDASGSMKGNKIKAAKKAGVALAYKAISEKNKVGLLVFETEIKESIPPTEDFPKLLEKISLVRATKQTDFIQMIKKSIELFPKDSNV